MFVTVARDMTCQSKQNDSRDIDQGCGTLIRLSLTITGLSAMQRSKDGRNFYLNIDTVLTLLLEAEYGTDQRPFCLCTFVLQICRQPLAPRHLSYCIQLHRVFAHPARYATKVCYFFSNYALFGIVCGRKLLEKPVLCQFEITGPRGFFVGWTDSKGEAFPNICRDWPKSSARPAIVISQNEPIRVWPWSSSPSSLSTIRICTASDVYCTVNISERDRRG